jgi:modulator of FtsH protease
VAAWHDFFVAAAGAAAALSGLIFVAVSINLRTILDQEKTAGSSYLTGRALESLAALLVVLGISLVGLDPSVSRVVFAAVLLTCAAGSGISPVRAALGYRSTHVKPTAYSLRMFLAGLLVAGYATAGATLLGPGGRRPALAAVLLHPGGHGRGLQCLDPPGRGPPLATHD